MAPPRGGGDSDGWVLSGERQTVAMVLATALHHSAGPKVEMQQRAALQRPSTGTGAEGEEVYEPNHAARRQTKPPPGVRPALPPEPADPRPALSAGVGRRGRGLRRPLRFLLQRVLVEEMEKEAEKESKAKELVVAPGVCPVSLRLVG